MKRRRTAGHTTIPTTALQLPPTPAPVRRDRRPGDEVDARFALEAVTANVNTIRTAREQRDEAMAAAREAGATWRAIAAAAGMTENGVRKALERAGDDE